MKDLRSGRPREIEEDTREQIVNLLEDKSVGSLRRAKRKLYQSGIDIGRSTIHQLPKRKKIQKTTKKAFTDRQTQRRETKICKKRKEKEL